jgi:hypothetical protein
VFETQKPQILENIKDAFVNGVHYFEAQDGHFYLYRGSGRNESMHRRLNAITPEKHNIETANAILGSFVFDYNAKRLLYLDFEPDTDASASISSSASSTTVTSEIPSQPTVSETTPSFDPMTTSCPSTNTATTAVAATATSAVVTNVTPATIFHSIRVNDAVCSNIRKVIGLYRLASIDDVIQLSQFDSESNIHFNDRTGLGLRPANPQVQLSSQATIRKYGQLKNRNKHGFT